MPSDKGVMLVDALSAPQLVDPDALCTALNAGSVRRADIEGCSPAPQAASGAMDDQRVLLLHTDRNEQRCHQGRNRRSVHPRRANAGEAPVFNS
jgi:hypothetical protein